MPTECSSSSNSVNDSSHNSSKGRRSSISTISSLNSRTGKSLFSPIPFSPLCMLSRAQLAQRNQNHKGTRR